MLGRWSAAQDAGPLAVVVEDLHGADADSRTALLTAARRLAGDRVLVLVTSRPGATDGWARLSLDARRCLRIEVGALAHRVAAADGPDPELAADLEAAAGGQAAVPAARTLLAAARVAGGVAGERLLLTAVRMLVAAGRPRQAAAHRAEVEGCADGPLRDLVLGLLDWEAGAAGPAEERLRRAAGTRSSAPPARSP